MVIYFKDPRFHVFVNQNIEAEDLEWFSLVANALWISLMFDHVC